MSRALLAAELDHRDARFPLERVLPALRDLYGLRGRLEALARERDHVHRLVDAANGAYVIRVSPSIEPLASLRLQCDALHAVARADPALPVPRVLTSTRGQDIEDLDAGGETFRLRVLTYLPGKPILAGPRSREQLATIGRTLARLDNALAGAALESTAFPLLWDMRASPQLEPFVRHVADAQGRRLVAAALAEFEAQALHRLEALPCQVIHNDFNPKNILFDDRCRTITGIIDFGDVVHAPRVVDVGVTIARHAEHDAPLRAGESILAGYCSAAPLTAAEIACLHAVVKTRLAMRAVIGSWRVHHDDPRGDRAQIDDALALLDRFTSLGADPATRCWQASAEAGHSPQR